MLNVSQGFKDALQNNVVYSDSYIVVYDVDESTNVTIDSDEIQEIEITSSSFINEKVIGNVVSYLMTIKILGDATSSINLTSEKHIEPYIGVLVNGAYEYVKYQKFIVDEVKYDDTTNITTIKCVDFLYKSNLEFSDTNTYPITLFQLAQSVATFLDLEIHNTSIVNGSFSIEDKRFPSFESCRTILSKIAELSGTFVRINKTNNKIEFVNAFPNMGSTHLDLSVFTHAQLSSFTHQGLEGSEPSSYHDQDNYFKLTLKDNKFGTKGINTLVIGYSVIEGENNTKVNQPNVAIDGNIEVQVLDNEIVNTEAKRLLVLDNLFDVVDEFKYQPFEMEYIGYPHIEIGDVVEFEKKDGTNVRSVVTDYSIRFNGGLFGNIKGRALSKVQTSYHNMSRNAKRLRNAEIMVDKANAEITLIASEVQTIDTDLGGIETRVSEAEQKITPTAIVSTVRQSTEYTTDLGGKVDTGTLANYSTITQTADKVALEIGNLQIGGANLIRNSGFEDDGLHWSPTHAGDTTYANTDNAPSRRYVRIVGSLNTTKVVRQDVPYTGIYDPRSSKFTFSGYFLNQHTTQGTVNPFVGVQIIVRYTDATVSYHVFNVATYYNTWTRRYIYLNTVSGKTINYMTVELIVRDVSSGAFIASSLKLEEGEKATAWTRHASEMRVANYIFDGEYATFKNGGLRIQNNAGTTVFDADTNGNLRITGQITATSGSFTGTVTSTSGSIAGWSITSNAISKGNVSLRSDLERIYFGTAYLYTFGTGVMATSGSFRVGSSFTAAGSSASILGQLDVQGGLRVKFGTIEYSITRDSNGFLRAL